MAAPEYFVSYAQNFEDVLLWRALWHVERGFYIDAGAGEPEADSVTCAFYQRGWSGINIEPAAAPFALLQAARPRDINLNVAAGAVDGESQFLLVGGGNGLSTLQEERFATLWEEGWPLELTRVSVRRLAGICRDHVPQHIHFLKIDVEGFERAVLEGSDLATWRPWIIVVEATRPNSQETSHAEWQDLLDAARYHLVYWDGLNRFYLAAEHAELASAFAAPPNVFDRFVRESEWKAKADAFTLNERVLHLAAEVREAHGRIVALQAAHDEQRAAMAAQHAAAIAERDSVLQALRETNRLLAEAAAARQGQIHALEAELSAVHQSTSWRLTAPIRAVKRFGRAS